MGKLNSMARKEIEDKINLKREWGHERVRMVERTERGKNIMRKKMMKRHPNLFLKKELKLYGIE